MKCCLSSASPDTTTRARDARGVTLIELCVVIAIILIMTVMAVPLMQSTLAYYQLQGAVAAASGAIQSTRYRAVSDGYPYRLSFIRSTNSFETYQIAKCPEWDPTNQNSCDFDSNVEGVIPFGDSHGAVLIGTNTQLKFWPGGKVEFLGGANPVTLSRAMGSSAGVKTKSITVSNYGSVKVQ